MRQFYLVLFICIAGIISAQGTQNFNLVTVPALPAGYIQTGGSNWTTSNVTPLSSALDTNYLRCVASGTGTYVLETQTFSTVGFTNINISFLRRKTSSAAPNAKLEWFDGAAYNTIINASPNTSPNAPTTNWALCNSAVIPALALPASANGVSNFKLRFTLIGNSGTASYQVDDIKITGTPVAITEFFSKSSGFLNILSTWGSNPDGSGASPANFTTPGSIFHIANNANPTINSTWTVNGAGTTVTVESGSNFTIPAGAPAVKYDDCGTCIPLDIASGGTVSIQDLSIYPVVGTINAGSTINYAGAGAQNVSGSFVYSNLTLSGSGIKSCILGEDVIVNGDFDLQPGIEFKLHDNPGNASSFTLFGSSTGNLGEIVSNDNSIIIVDGAATSSGNLRFKSTSTLGLLDFLATNTTLGIESNLNVKELRFSNPGNVSKLQIIGASKLTVRDEITGNPTFSGNENAEIEITGAGVNNFNLSMEIDPGIPTVNAFKNFTLNRAITITLANELKIANDLNVVLGTITTNGNLTLLSDAISTGRILPLFPPTSDVDGNIKVNRFNAAGFTGWAMMASPVKGSTFADIDDDIAITCPVCPDGSSTGGSAFNSAFTYDETRPGTFNDFASYLPIGNIADPMTNGTGYYVYFGDDQVNSNDITWDVSGPFAKEEVRLLLTSTAGGTNGANISNIDDGFNFVGNPYPAPISWDEVYNATISDPAGADAIFNSYYIYSSDEVGGAGGFYSYVDGTSETPGIMDDGIIPLGQAFFVQTQGPAGRTPELIFTENAKNTLNNTPFYLKSAFPQVTKHQDCHFKLTRVSDNKSANTAITFKENATVNRDMKYDAIYKTALPVELSVNPKAMLFYTILNGVNYSINAIPPVNGHLVLDLYTKVGMSGDYKISANNLNAIPEGYCINLFDKTLNINHDLKSGDYTCALNSSDVISRFVLTISNASFNISSTSSAPLCNNASNGLATVNVKGQGPFNYVWRNANNQIIAETKNSNTNTNTINDLIGGTYKVEVSKLGQCAVASQTIEIEGVDAAIANFEMPSNTNMSSNGQANIVFNNTSDKGTEFTWDFGDGKKVTNNNTVSVSHAYVKEGTYKVVLQAKNGDCNEASIVSKYLTVKDPSGFGASKLAALDNVKIWKDEKANLHLVFDNIMNNGKIEIHNLVGQKLFSTELKNNTEKEIVIENVSDIILNQIGIIKLKTENKQVAKRIAF